MPIIRLGKVLQIANTVENRLNREEVEELITQLQIRLYEKPEYHSRYRDRGKKKTP